NRVRIRATCRGPGIDLPASYWMIDETVDFAEPFDCGLVGYAAGGYGNRNNGVQEFHLLSVEVTDETCGTPAETECPVEEPWDEEPTPPFPGTDCTVWLGVYEADRTTLAWEATTSPTYTGFGSAVPYLVEPSSYGEQECDFAEG